MRTGSLINELMSNSKQPTPVVGMGATILCHTDRYPVTVVAVSKNGKLVVVQHDNYTRIDTNGMSDTQNYTYTPNTNGHKETFTLRTNGAWVRQGSSAKSGTALRLGHRERYYDFSF